MARSGKIEIKKFNGQSAESIKGSYGEGFMGQVGDFI